MIKGLLNFLFPPLWKEEKAEECFPQAEGDEFKRWADEVYREWQQSERKKADIQFEKSKNEKR